MRLNQQMDTVHNGYNGLIELHLLEFNRIKSFSIYLLI